MTKSEKPAKKKYRLKLIEYIGNPENEFPNRSQMSLEILRLNSIPALYDRFTKEELTEIEQEGLELRRNKYLRYSGKVDYALIKKALEGDVSAIKLYYQKVENWSEKQIKEHVGKEGEQLAITHLMDLKAIERAAGKIKNGE